MELAIQSWLRDFARLFPGQRDLALAKLEADFAIKARRHSKLPHLVLLKYDQISSPFKEELVQDCRGLILNEAADYAVACMTYRKFFNQGETLAADIHWPSACVWEKLDGSLIQLYHIERYGWQPATSGTPDADTPIGDFGKTFGQLFWETIKAQGIRVDLLNEGYCYAFELCSPLNRVVVRHDAPVLYLHGVRDLRTLEEVNIGPEAFQIGAPIPDQFPLGSIEECFSAAAKLDPLAHEGFVVRDKFFRRVKIKSPSYVALHHAKDGLLSKRMMANTIRAGEYEELRTALEAFPELAHEFEKLRQAHRDLVNGAQVVFKELLQELPNPFSRKDFALRAKQYPLLSGVLFYLLDRHIQNGKMGNPEALARTYFADLHEKAYGRLVGIAQIATG